MTKNTKTILLSLLACLILITGFELGAGRLKFGGATLNDSTASLITTNKGFLVNGKLSTSNYADFSNGVRFGDTDITIDDDGLDLRYIVENGGQHIFTTKTGTELATIDSATGVGIKINSGANFTGSLVKTKLIKGITPATVATLSAYPHGITNGRILGFTCLVKRDTIASFSYQNDPMYPPNSAIPAYSYNAYVDSVNCGVYMLAAATYLLGDSAFFLIQYLD